MKREWKPGDVAISTFCGEDSVRVVRYVDGWARLTDTDDYIPDDSMMGTYTVTEARPLVVVDPEDREEVERLMRLGGPHGLFPAAADQMQAALREFANPTPPKPEEPLGDGAVVEDSEGRRWTRIAAEGYIADGAPVQNLSPPWRRRGMSGKWWDNVTAVRVLSEGVTA